MIERVYLFKGNIVELDFSNKIRRKLKSIEGEHFFMDPEDLKTPLHNPDGSRAWTQKGFPFPEKLKYFKNPETNKIEIKEPEHPLFYGWTKYNESYTPYIFPKTYEYANW